MCFQLTGFLGEIAQRQANAYKMIEKTLLMLLSMRRFPSYGLKTRVAGWQRTRVPGCQSARLPVCKVPRCQSARVGKCQGVRMTGLQCANV
jgi:hypothetical protein